MMNLRIDFQKFLARMLAQVRQEIRMEFLWTNLKLRRRIEQPDRLDTYRYNYKSLFPLNDKNEEFLKVPSLDDMSKLS